MANTTVLGPVRFSYLHALEMKEDMQGELFYSTQVWIPSGSAKLLDKAEKAVKEAIKYGLSKSFFKQADVPRLHLPIRDGSQEHADGEKGAEYKNIHFFNCKTKKRPAVVDKFNRPIEDDEEVYSGMWGYIAVNFYPYYRMSKGIGVGLVHIMKTKDDDRLDGRPAVEDVFGDYFEEGENKEGSNLS